MTQVPNWFRVLIFVLFVAAIAGWIAISNESFYGSPGRQGDDVYFENIAYHLAKGEGIKFDFRDEEWRRPYREANRAGVNDWIFYLQVRGVTTSRSPGFPMLVAGIYKIFGRNWLAVRIVVGLMLAAALTLLIDCVIRFHGWLAGILATVTLSLDYFVLRTAGQFMTEGLGAVIVCILFCAIIHLTHSRSDWSPSKKAIYWLVIGLIYGFGILVRANLNAWLVLAFSALIFLVTVQVLRRKPIGWLIWPALSFCLGVLIVAGPWWARNCIVTKAFCPFGTSGSFGIAGGFSDAAYANFGNWDPNVVTEVQNKTLAQPGIFEKSLSEQEYLMGRESSHQARQWATNNIEKLPLLMLMKAYSHLGLYRQPIPLIAINALMLFVAVIGCYISRRSSGFWILVFVGLSLVATMLTWSHYGRYSIPIRPLIHVACAIGTIAFWRYVIGIFRTPRPIRP